MGNYDAQNVQDPLRLPGYEWRTVIDIHHPNESMCFEDVLDAGFELNRAFGEGEVGVQHPTGGIIQEAHQDRLPPAAFAVRYCESKQVVCLHAFQRVEKVKLQALLLLCLVHPAFSVHPRNPNQTR